MDKTRIPRRALLVAAGLAFTSIPLQAETFTGTAFAVSEEGDLVTNEHVISGCSGDHYGETLTVRQGKLGTAGTVRVSDKSLDLAIVRISPTAFGPASKLRGIAALRESPPLRAGEQAISYGFPLIGELATEGNLTIGNVSALHGLGDNPHYIQITTPVQPGNSGGPLLDSGGNIIGVVAAKLNALRVMRAMGDIPQNVNFAVELGTLRRFLSINGVHIARATSTADLHPADIGERAKLFTYLIECNTGTIAAAPAQTPIPNRPEHRTPAPQPAPLKPIQLDPKKLKFSAWRPYPSIAPERFNINISNAGSDRVTELMFGVLYTEEKLCSGKPEDYDALKRFTVNLSLGDNGQVVTRRRDRSQWHPLIGGGIESFVRRRISPPPAYAADGMDSAAENGCS